MNPNGSEAMTTTTKRRTLRPLLDQVVVKPAEAREQEGSIFIPDAAREQPMEGVVVSTGPGKVTEHGISIPNVHTGDTVVYRKYAGTEVEVDGVKLLILRCDDVLAVLETVASMDDFAVDEEE